MLAVLCLVAVFVLVIAGGTWYTEASDASYKAGLAASREPEPGRRGMFGVEPSSVGAEFPLRMQSTAATAKAYTAFGAAGSALFGALVSWTVAGFLRSAAGARSSS